jgi:hypothetical protein
MGSIMNEIQYPPTPKVDTLPATASTEEIVAALTTAGGCIVKSFVSQDILDGLREDFYPLLEADHSWTGA